MNHSSFPPGECGGNVTGFIGALTSPHYPRFYGDKMTCQWDILTTEGTGIKLIMATFEMESPTQGGNCTTVDYLEVSFHFWGK